MLDIDFNPITMSGFTTYVINSSVEADKVIDAFEQAIENGVSADYALSYALDMCNMRWEDFTHIDQARITRKVEEVINDSSNTEERNRY